MSSVTERLTVKGYSVDLSSACSGLVCGPDYTLFLGGTNGFDLSSDGNSYLLRADIDKSKTDYAESERQIDKAIDRIVDDYAKRQSRLKSWNNTAH